MLISFIYCSIGLTRLSVVLRGAGIFVANNGPAIFAYFEFVNKGYRRGLVIVFTRDIEAISLYSKGRNSSSLREASIGSNSYKGSRYYSTL